MCLNLYDYQSKASRYSYGSTYLKTRVTTNQNYTIDSQKPKTKELKHKEKTIKPQKEKQKGEEINYKNDKINWKQGLKWQ